MLNQLLETKQVARRKTGGTLVSLVLHVLVVGAVVHLTERSLVALERPEQVEVRLMPVEPKPPTPAEPHPADAVATVRSPLGHLVLTAPVDIPVDIPAVDLSAAPTNPEEWVPKGATAGSPTGDPTATGPVVGDQPMESFQVDKPAAALPGTVGPAYPEILKSSGVEGSAMVQFVVDTLGRAEPGSFKVLTSSHPAFGAAVLSALPRMRFLPAESRGQKVRMLVQQPFAFALSR